MRHATPIRSLLATGIVIALATAAAQAAAQERPAQERQDPVTLSKITVTAQKREEALQDVPVTVTAVSEELLRDTGVRDVKDLQVLVPGLTVTSTQNEAITTARIRGIGTVGDNVGLESSVGVVIDGVYRPRNSVGFGDLGELERIEVLKGPQGTVFGKNTSAGVINVVTRAPYFGQEAGLELTAGNHGALGIAASYNDAFNDVAAFRVYAAKRARDGWMDVRTGAGPRQEHDDYDQNFHTLRGKFLLRPSENFEATLSADYTSREENCCTAVQLVTGATGPLINALGGGNAIASPAAPEARVAFSNRSTEQDIKEKGVALQLDWTLPGLGGATLTSITAKRDWGAIAGLDYDFSNADLLYRSPNRDESWTGFKTFSQELRLTGSLDAFDWMVGAFYSDEDLDRNESYRIGPGYEPYVSTLVGQMVLSGVASALAPRGLTVNMANPATFLSQVSGRPYGTGFAGLGALDRHRQNAKSLALFTNNTWHATDALDITLGLRHTSEDKTLDSVFTNPNGSAACAATLANPGARVGGALAQRINGFSSLPGAVQQQLLAGLVPAIAPQVAGYMCLPWANVLHNGRTIHQERDESEWSGTLKAAYRFSDAVMAYASAARGYKAGGFNLDRVQSSNGLSSGGAGITPVNDTSFPGEFVDSYELGAKTTWAGGNLLLNAALFHQTYENFQLNSFLGTSFVVRSIPEVVSQGIDTELLWQPVTGLMLQGGLMYADTKYGDSIPGCDFVGPGQTSTACPSIGQLYKLPGAQMSFAPKWSGTASATYEWDVGDTLAARVHLGGKYMSEFNTGSDLDVEKLQPAFTIWNARVGIGRSDRRWMLELWAQNLTNQHYIQVGFDGPLQALGSPLPNSQHAAGDPLNTYNAFLGAPRMYGVTFRLNY